MKIIERIQYYEQLLDEIRESMKQMSQSIEEYEICLKKMRELENYYHSDMWKQDYEDDECGKIPHYIKRGVLSQDAIYNLLCENDELLKNMEKLLDKYK